MSNEKTYQGRRVAVVEVKGGWTTILDGMKQIKVRNSELSEAIVPMTPEQLKKASKAKPAKAPKANARAVNNTTTDATDESEGRLVKADLTRYEVSDEVKTASGRKAIDIGDDVAASLRGMDLAEVYKVAAAELGETQKALHERYDHLNPGMQRMNLGNRIRGTRAAAARAESAEA